MANVKASVATFRGNLERVLREGLAKAGIKARVDFADVPGTKLTRVFVLSKQFKNLRPSERQDLVWRIISQHFTADQQLLISMIITLDEADIGKAFMNWSEKDAG